MKNFTLEKDGRLILNLSIDEALKLANRITRCSCVEKSILIRRQKGLNIKPELILQYAFATPYAHDCLNPTSDGKYFIYTTFRHCYCWGVKGFMKDSECYNNEHKEICCDE